MSSKYFKNNPGVEYAKKGPSQTKRTMIVDPKGGIARGCGAIAENKRKVTKYT